MPFSLSSIVQKTAGGKNSLKNSKPKFQRKQKGGFYPPFFTRVAISFR